jgi:hypothetical protein
VPQEESVLKLQTGDEIKLTEADFARCAAAKHGYHGGRCAEKADLHPQ